MSAAEPLPLEPWSDRPVVGVSACLLGEEVRTNGGHCRSRFLTHDLGRHVDWLTVCPEVELGLGVPRPTLRLVGAVRRRTPRRDRHLGGPHAAHARPCGGPCRSAGRPGGGRLGAQEGLAHVRCLPREGLRRERQPQPAQPRPVRHRRRGPLSPPSPRGGGASERSARCARTSCSGCSRAIAGGATSQRDGSVSGLMQFHAENKFLLLAHDPGGLPRAGPPRRRSVSGRLPGCLERYGRRVRPELRATGLPRPARQRAAAPGRLPEGRTSTRRTRSSSVGSSPSYRAGEVPLVVPLTLLRHLLRRHDASGWARAQTYLEPYPADLMLRNQV